MAGWTMQQRFRGVRNRYRDDIPFFGLPALALFTAGLTACALTGRYGGPLGAILMAGLIPVILGSIRMEESLLIEEFGEAYLEYRRSVKKLIPFIY